jgi:hypothetical protein
MPGRGMRGLAAILNMRRVLVAISAALIAQNVAPAFAM